MNDLNNKTFKKNNNRSGTNNKSNKKNYDNYIKLYYKNGNNFDNGKNNKNKSNNKKKYNNLNGYTKAPKKNSDENKENAVVNSNEKVDVVKKKNNNLNYNKSKNRNNSLKNNKATDKSSLKSNDNKRDIESKINTDIDIKPTKINSDIDDKVSLSESNEVDSPSKLDVVPLKQTKKEKIMEYLKESLLFTLIMFIIDVMLYLLVDDVTVLRLFDIKFLNIIVTILIVMILLFSVSFGINYLVSELLLDIKNRRFKKREGGLYRNHWIKSRKG